MQWSDKISSIWLWRIWYILFAYISLVPFYYFSPPQLTRLLPAFYIFKFFPIILIVLLGIWSIFKPVAHWHLRPNRVFDYAVAAFFFTNLLSLWQSSFPLVGGGKLVYFVLSGILLAYLLPLQIAHVEDAFDFVRIIVFISSCVAVYGIVVYLFGEDLIWGRLYEKNNPYYSGTDRASSTLGNAIYVGSYITLCLPFVLWAFFNSQTRNQKIVLGVFFIFDFSGLLITFSRGAWLASMCALGTYLYLKERRWIVVVVTGLKLQRIILMLTIIGFTLPILEAEGLGAPLFKTQTGIQQRLEALTRLFETESFRLAQYDTAWRVLQEHPFLGVGVGNFTRLFEQYKSPSTPAHGQSRTTENMYLMFVCETGILGLLVTGAVFFFLGRELYAGYEAITGSSEKDLVAAVLASLVGFLVNIATWDAINQPTVRMTFWILMGIGLGVIRLFVNAKPKGAEAQTV